MKKNMRTRIFAMLLVVSMIFTMMPETSFAADTVAVPEVTDAVEPTGEGETIDVSVSVYDYTAKDAGITGASETGIIFENETVSILPGASAADVIKAAATQAGKSMEQTASGWINTINGLGHVEEYSSSGWSYGINGDYNNYNNFSDGCTLTVNYTVDGGADINNGYKADWSAAPPTFTAFSIAGVEADLSELKGSGTKEDPYSILVKDTQDIIDVTAAKVNYATTLNSNYVAFDTTDEMTDISQQNDFSSIVNCCLTGTMGTNKTYYRIAVIRDEINIWPEMIADYTLPVSSQANMNYSWSSDNAAIRIDEGVVKVMRQSADTTVTMTVTITSGTDTVSKDYTVLVPAVQDTTTAEGKIKEATYESRAYYLANRTLSDNWTVWAAYSALGDYIQDEANGYAFSAISTTATPTGANILALITSGANPYNYQGVNLIEKRRQAGLTGAYSAPIYNLLAMEAAGANCADADKTAAFKAATDNMLEDNMGMGPDMGAWSAILASRHLADTLGTEEGINDKISSFLSNANKAAAATVTFGGDPTISLGCIMNGLTALHAAGMENCDVTTDAQWITGDYDYVTTLYTALHNDEDSTAVRYRHRYRMEFSDLYNALYENGNAVWITAGINKTKLEDLKTKAEAMLAITNYYTADSMSNLSTALAAVNALSEEQINAAIPTYGEQYYALSDAIQYAEIDGVDSDNDIAAAFEVTVNALPEAAALTLNDETALVDIRAAYDALTNHQKGKVSQAATAKIAALEEQLKVLKRLGLTLGGNYTDVYSLEVTPITATDNAYKNLAAKLVTGKILCTYGVQVYDEDLQKYATTIEGNTTLNIPLTASYEKYTAMVLGADGVVTYVTPTYANGKITVDADRPGTYAVVGYHSLGAPTVTVKAASYNSAKISWAKMTAASKYEVYRATSKNGKYSKIATVTGTSYTNKKLTVGKTYYYKVTAAGNLYGTAYTTAASSIKNVKMTLATPRLKVNAGKKKATVKWNKVSGANGYVIYRSTSKNGNYKKITTVKSAKTVTYINKKLKAKKTYFYRVRAYRTVNGKKVYSSYTTKVKVKTK